MFTQLTQGLVHVPFGKIFVIAVIWGLILSFKKIITNVVIVKLEEITSKTNTHLDDQLIEVIKPPLVWLIFLAGIELSKIILAQYLPIELNLILGKLINLMAVSICAYIVYCVAPILGEVLKTLTLRSETELDDLLVPYLPKVFQISAILLVILKGSEVLLGASATAILGLLGGAGLAFGLLLKDVIYDTCCTIIIYLDKIYRVGDIIVTPDIPGFARIIDIGLRSTTLCINKNNSIKKIPNSKMINGIVENWSQDPENNSAYGINLTIKIDHLSAQQAERIYTGLGEIPKSIDYFHDKIIVNFDGIDTNARVFTLRSFCKDFSKYSPAQAALTLAVLRFLEKEQINYLNVALSAEVPIKQ